MEIIELSDKANLIYEASVKIHTGRQMVAEGLIELAHLTGEKVVGQLKEEAGPKLVANKTLKRSSFNKDVATATDGKLMKEMVYIISRGTDVSINQLHQRLHLGERRVNKLVGLLVQGGKIKARTVGNRTYYDAVYPIPKVSKEEE